MLEALQPFIQLGGQAVISIIVIWAFYKLHSQMMRTHSTERKEWYSSQERQADKVTKALENLSTAINRKK